MTADVRKIWLLSHPLKDGAKAKAKLLNVKIVDAIFKDNYEESQLYKEPKSKKACKKAD